MGQRLNIEIVDGETTLANCYYHWSGYTGSALALTKRIIEEFYRSKSIASVKMAVELLELTGGGVNEEERSNIAKFPDKFGHIKFKDAVNRNDGLICVTDDGMAANRKWEEARVTIDIGHETFNFSAFWDSTLDDFNEYRDKDDTRQLEDFAECEYDLTEIPFSEFDSFDEFVDRHPEGVRAKGEDWIIQWIE